MNRIIIDRAIDNSALLKLLQMFDHQRGFKSVRTVVINLCAFFVTHIMVGFIIIIVPHHRHLASEFFRQIFGNSTLTAPGASGDPDDQHFSHTSTPLFPYRKQYSTFLPRSQQTSVKSRMNLHFLQIYELFFLTFSFKNGIIKRRFELFRRGSCSQFHKSCSLPV